jgi:hypothetical protein
VQSVDGHGPSPDLLDFANLNRDLDHDCPSRSCGQLGYARGAVIPRATAPDDCWR